MITSFFVPSTLGGLPADFYKMSRSQMERLSEYACDSMIADMYNLPKYEIMKRRRDFGLDQATLTAIKAEREDESVAIQKEILRIVSEEYNNGNIPHTNSTPLNSEKEFLYMKATGIVRRIDDLGRVVIPKEIRRTMRIREGDPLEIFTDRDGEVIFKKYSPIGELSELAVTYCDVLVKSTEQTVIICDRDHCIAAGGIPKKEVLERRITSSLEDIMEGRRLYVADSVQGDRFTALEGVDRPVTIAAPILTAGDISGVVVFLGDNENTSASQSDIKLASVAAGFLGKNMEEY